MGNITGLSAPVLEYVVLGLAVAYLLVAFFADRVATTSRLGKVLDLIKKGLPFVETQARKELTRAKAKELEEAKATAPAPEGPEAPPAA